MEKPDQMTVAIFTPNDRREGTEPYPVIIGINRCGNHSVHHWGGITITETVLAGLGCTRSQNVRGTHENFWSVEMILERGYAFAAFHQTDLDSDSENMDDGIHASLYQSSVERAGDARAAWAWGFSRAVDYLQTEPLYDSQRIAVVGHSRRGKAAVLAGAFDERVALVVPHQAGTGGDALSRGTITQEPVFLVNWFYPNWFNDISAYINSPSTSTNWSRWRHRAR